MSRLRTLDQMRYDRREIARLKLEGWTVPEIADHLKLTEVMVARDLAAIRKEWREGTALDVQTERQAMLRQLDRIMREAWAAWARSQENRATISTEETGAGDGEGGKTKHTRKVEQQVGAPRFLEIIERCLERRAKLLGLDMPQKVAQTDAEGNEIELSEEEKIARIAAIMERARARRLATQGTLEHRVVDAEYEAIEDGDDGDGGAE